jgi:hypothetical protein
LPGGDEDGFQKGILRKTIFAAVEALGGTCSVRDRRTGKPFFRTEITIECPTNTTLIATGDGYSREGAIRAAALHALAKMRDKGLLTLSGSPTKEQYPDEKGGMLDVYNYAARYRCIPSVIIRKFKAFFTITIDMPEHGINVAIMNVVSIAHGEAAAAREFKRQAELYHLSKGNDNVVVRDRHALSTHNAQDFCTFCRDSGETSARLDVRMKRDGDLWVGRPCFEDLALDPKVELEVRTASKSHALDAANLVAALSIVKMKPHLFDGFSKALRAGNGKYLATLSPKYVVLNTEVMRELNVIQNLEWPDQAQPSCSRPAQWNSDISRETRPKRPLNQNNLRPSHLNCRRNWMITGRVTTWKVYARHVPNFQWPNMLLA